MKRIAIALLLLFLLWAAKERFFVSETSRLKRQLKAMVQAVEAGDLSRLSQGIAPDYSDGRGWDRASLLAGVRFYRGQQGALRIHISELLVWVEPPRAEAKFIATVVSAREGATTEINGERFHLYFRKEKRSWLLINAEIPKLRFE